MFLDEQQIFSVIYDNSGNIKSSYVSTPEICGYPSVLRSIE